MLAELSLIEAYCNSHSCNNAAITAADQSERALLPQLRVLPFSALPDCGRELDRQALAHAFVGSLCVGYGLDMLLKLHTNDSKSQSKSPVCDTPPPHSDNTTGKSNNSQKKRKRVARDVDVASSTPQSQPLPQGAERAVSAVERYFADDGPLDFQNVADSIFANTSGVWSGEVKLEICSGAGEWAVEQVSIVVLPLLNAHLHWFSGDSRPGFFVGDSGVATRSGVPDYDAICATRRREHADDKRRRQSFASEPNKTELSVSHLRESPRAPTADRAQRSRVAGAASPGFGEIFENQNTQYHGNTLSNTSIVFG